MTFPASSLPPGRAASPVSRALLGVGVVPLTVEQYARMIQEGILSEDAGVELLDGVLVRKDRGDLQEDSMGHSPAHKLVVALLAALAGRLEGHGVHLQIQLPVECPPDSVPEPDASIVRGAPRDYADRLPTAADVTSVIEAAHSSLTRDREDKLPIYAASGVPQYVIVNLQHEVLEVHTDPDPGAAQYRTKRTLERADALGLNLAQGTLQISASEILP